MRVAFTDSSVMCFKHFKLVTFCGSKAWADGHKVMPKIPFAAGEMEFGHAQVQHQELIPLACVLEGIFVRCLDTKAALMTIQTWGTLNGGFTQTCMSCLLSTRSITKLVNPNIESIWTIGITCIEHVLRKN